MDDWLSAPPNEFEWCIGSVNRPGCERMVAWLRRHGVGNAFVLDVPDMPLAVDVNEPQAVGIDRLANTLAASRLRPAGQRAIVVALGTAITVDLVGPHGAFEGGAILPGIAMAAKALYDLTDLLPLEPMWELGTPPPRWAKRLRPVCNPDSTGEPWGACANWWLGSAAMASRCQSSSRGRPAPPRPRCSPSQASPRPSWFLI